MNHGSLFSGIGGFDLAAEWMGWDNKFHCDINPFSRRICKYYWPNAKSYDNIKTTDFTIWRGHIDVLSGGFPCQPFSTAGKRLGKEDDRHLWPEMFRAIREIRPRYVVGENVRGLLNWSDGLVLEEVYSDLESEGYEIETFLLPAVGINAPHKRDRVYIIASDSKRIRLEYGNEARDIHSTVSEAQKQECEFADDTKANDNVYTQQGGPSETWDSFPIKSPLCSGDDGLPDQLDGFTFPKWRKESIMGYGNAIVPQIAYRIFETINEIENRFQAIPEVY